MLILLTKTARKVIFVAMKRKAVKILVSLLAILVAGYALLFAFDTQANVAAARPDTIIASLPLAATQPLTVRVADGLMFKFDTGSDISCITPADLEKLRARGAVIRTKHLPMFGRTSNGRICFSAKRYVIDLPLEYYTAHPDSNGNNYSQQRMAERDNVLREVEFMLLETPGDVSCFGIDLLRNFAIEHLYNEHLIRIHTERPDGYQDFSPLNTSYWPSHTPWPGRRYYITLDVDHVSDDYFLDTGLRNASVKLPWKRAEKSRRRLSTDSLVSQFGVFPARTDDAWVECGNRAGTQVAFYCDNAEEPFIVNPLNLFTQDMLIDFPNSSIALRPFVALPKRHFLGRDTLIKDITGESDTARKTRIDTAGKESSKAGD